MKNIFLPLASLISIVMIHVPGFALTNSNLQSRSVAQITNQSSAQLRIQKIQELVRTAGSQGLNYSLYFTAAIETDLQNLANTNEVALDKKLNAIVSRLAKDLSRGRVLPTSLDIKAASVKVKSFAYQILADSYLNGNMSADEFIVTVIPKNRIYREAQALFQRLVEMKSQNLWTDRPASLALATVSKKTKNPGLIAYTRKKLDNFGYSNNLSSTIYDLDLENSIRAFQTDNNLGSDGVAGTTVTWKYLDKSIDQLITQAALNLDRMRWLPDQNSAEYIYINLVRQSFQYFENEIETLGFKTVNGRFDRQTPILVDTAKQVVLNATWNVPRGIFVKDKIAQFIKDPNYASKNHMKLYSDATGKQVDPTTIDWTKPASELPYSLIQDPGPWNALGFMKFPLNNGFAIYMHDTNERNLFNENERLRSSGCIRLEKPFEVAEKFLASPEWTVDSLKAYTEFAPVQATKPKYINLNRTIPVYVFYQTMLNSNGKLIASNDVYGIDKTMYDITISGK